MQTQRSPHAEQGGEGRESLDERSTAKDSSNWRDWLDLPSMGWVTDGGEVTADWTVA